MNRMIECVCQKLGIDTGDRLLRTSRKLKYLGNQNVNILFQAIRRFLYTCRSARNVVVVLACANFFAKSVSGCGTVLQCQSSLSRICHNWHERTFINNALQTHLSIFAKSTLFN